MNNPFYYKEQELRQQAETNRKTARNNLLVSILLAVVATGNFMTATYMAINL